MPRVKPLDQTLQADKELRGEIARYLAENNMDKADLAVKLHISRATFYERCNNPAMFRLQELRRLKAVIGDGVKL
jgi:hypothetical protein